MNGPTGCICGVKDLTESGHEFGCPMYLRARQQENRFYREPYRDEFNTTRDAEEGYTAAVRLATVLMQKHWPEAKGWQPAPDLLGVITQLDHITAHLLGCFAGPVPKPSASIPACTCHPDDRDNADCPRKHAAHDCHVARHIARDRFANDEAAKTLYDTWRDQPGWVPWVERGNSTKQEEARRQVEPHPQEPRDDGR